MVMVTAVHSLLQSWNQREGAFSELQLPARLNWSDRLARKCTLQ